MDVSRTLAAPRLALPAARPAFALPALAAAAGIACFLQGAYYLPQLLAALGACLVGLVVARGAALGRYAATGFTALALALAASAAANDGRAPSLKPVATLCFAAACATLARRAIAHDGAEAIARALVWVAAVVGAAGIVGVVLHIEAWAMRSDPWRLTSTLTYQNAAGSLLALAIAPAAALASIRPSRASRAALVTIAVALAATFSRGAILAAVVALVIVAPRLRRAAMLRAALPARVGSLAVVAAAAGVRGGTALAFAGLGLAALAVARPVPARAAALSVAALVVAGATVAATTPVAGRLTGSTMDRARVWSETAARMQPSAFGSGPGTYALIAPIGGVPHRTEHAHNEYLQALSETGVVGIASIGIALALFAAAVRRARPARGTARTLWLACVGSGVGFVLHSGLDFVWRVPALVGFAFALFAVALAATHTEEPS